MTDFTETRKTIHPKSQKDIELFVDKLSNESNRTQPQIVQTALIPRTIFE